MIEVRYDHGVYLPVYDLWLDPWEAKRFAFVSHAHSDHIAPHKEIILSERTARLLVRQSPGDLVFTRWRGTDPDVARLRLSDDAHLRTIRTVVLRICALQQE